MACENKNTHKHKFSQTEIEAARQLIQLSNSSIADSNTTTDFDEDHHSSNSVQWKPQQSKVGDDDASLSPSTSPSDEIEDVLADIEEDESLRRRNKRFRYIQDIYNATDPIVPESPLKPNKVTL